MPQDMQIEKPAQISHTSAARLDAGLACRCSTKSATHQGAIGHMCRVQWIDGLTLAGGSTVDTVALNETHEDNLGEDNGDDGLGVDEAGVAQVV